MTFDVAAAQFEAGQLLRSSFSGSRWSGNHACHYNWCLPAKDMDPNGELKVRKDLMADCAPEYTASFRCKCCAEQPGNWLAA